MSVLVPGIQKAKKAKRLGPQYPKHTGGSYVNVWCLYAKLGFKEGVLNVAIFRKITRLSFTSHL